MIAQRIGATIPPKMISKNSGLRTKAHCQDCIDTYGYSF
jgi:hypothetical protein